MRDRITIGITDCSKYGNYHQWIAAEPGVDIIKLSPDADNVADVLRCHGVVLTGGEDVHPRFYGKPEFVSRCHEIDERRDEFERRVLEYTEKQQVPVLGICRGLQIANVFFGGTLLPHIPDYGKPDHAKSGNDDRYHAVMVKPGTQLGAIVGDLSGEVNSAHHQGADIIGTGLAASALSPDGVIEGLERANKKDGFLLLVQWHPERMKDQGSVFSKNVRGKFLDAAREH